MISGIIKGKQSVVTRVLDKINENPTGGSADTSKSCLSAVKHGIGGNK